ncbi:hypothetical protein RRG08_049094 [Elysia crispata]|uniref:Uncharacterized protein n=1 Tax=Elysia crispata TaxID=231223 RepID=A0AAE1ECV2_9GAST|nr:hypothetical protein RRG08_049094 [Elysia crispata]
MEGSVACTASTVSTLSRYSRVKPDCRAGQFGLRCERQCNCAVQGSCFIHSGGCPSGCASGCTGEDCSACPRGQYGPKCNETCSVYCAGPAGQCETGTGDCYQGSSLRIVMMSVPEVASQQREAAGGSDPDVWAVAATTVAAVTVAVLAVLVWRQYKIFKDRTSTSAYNNDIGGVEAAPPEDGNRQKPAQQVRDRELGPNLAGIKRMPGQQGRAGMRRPNRRYDTMETTSPQNVQVYDTGFVNCDSPLDSMTASVTHIA